MFDLTDKTAIVTGALWADATKGVRLEERRAMPPFGHFALIRFAKFDEAAAKPADQPGIRVVR